MSILLSFSLSLQRNLNRVIRPFICNSVFYKTYRSNAHVQSIFYSCSDVTRSQDLTRYTPKRLKYTKKYEDSSDSEDEVETVQDVGKDFKVLKIHVNSLRSDLVLKAALGMARSKVEAAFYQSKVRVNGLKLLKKSAQLKVEDEIDIVRGTSKLNSEFLVVSRVKILSYAPKDDKYAVFVQCFKSLTIENYPKAPFKMSESDPN